MVEQVLTICAWCPKGERLTILNAGQFRDGEMDLLFVKGRLTRAVFFPTGTWIKTIDQAMLKISDGICPACKAEHFPEVQPKSAEAKR